MIPENYVPFVHDEVPLPDFPRRPGVRPIAVCISDTHVRPGARIWKHAPKPYGDILYAFRQCAHIVAELQPEFVFLLGDILHTSINPADVLGIVNIFFQLLPKAAVVYFVQGQHDLSSPPWLSLLGSSSRTPVSMALGSRLLRSSSGLSVLGLDFTRTPYNTIYAILEANRPEEVDILVTHQAWKDILGPAGNASFQDLELIPGLKLVLSGDIHAFSQFTYPPQVNDYQSSDVRLKSSPSSDRFRIIFPGTPCITDLNGQPPYGILVLWPDLSVTHIPLLGRSVYRPCLQTMEDLERFRAEHPPESMLDPNLPGDLQIPILYASGVSEVLLVAKKFYEEVTYFRMSLKSSFSSSAPLNSPDVLHTEGYDFRVQLLNYLISKNSKYAAVYREFLRVLERPEERDTYFRRAIAAVLAAEGFHEDSIL